MYKFIFSLIFFVFYTDGMQNSKKEEEGLSQSRPRILRTIDEDVTPIIVSETPRRLILYPFNHTHCLLETQRDREKAFVTFLKEVNIEKIDFLDICRLSKLAEGFTVGDIIELIEQAKKIADNNPIGINHLIAALFLHDKSRHLKQKEVPIVVRKIIIDNIVKTLHFNDDKTITSFLNDFVNRINPFNISSVHNIFHRAVDIRIFHQISLTDSLELANKCEQDKSDFK